MSATMLVHAMVIVIATPRQEPPTQLPPLVVTARTQAEVCGEALLRVKGCDVEAALRLALEGDLAQGDLALFTGLEEFFQHVFETAQVKQRNISLGKPPVTGRVQRFDATTLVLKPIQKSEVAIARSSVGWEELFEVARKLDVQDPGVQASLLVLNGVAADDAVKRLRLRDSAVVSRLREDAKRWAHAVDMARARDRLVKLARTVAEPASDSATMLTEVDALLRELRDSDATVRHRGALLALGESLLARTAGELPGLPGFEGRARDLDDGEVEVHYAFDDPRELDDFVLEPQVPLALRAPLSPTSAKANVSVVEGALEFCGDGALVHRARFTSPMSVEYAFAHTSKELDTGGFMGPGVFITKLDTDLAVMLSSEDHGHFAAGVDSVALLYANRETSSLQALGPEKPVTLLLDVMYPMVLQHEGGRIQLWSEGEPLRTLTQVPELDERSHVELVHRGKLYTMVSHLTIRGRLVPEGKEELRSQWIATQRAKWTE